VPPLLDSDLELRPGWRCLAYLMVYVVLFLATGAVMSEVIPGPVDFGGLRGLALTTLTFLPPAVLALVFMLRFVEARPAAAFGVALHERWGRDLGLGLLVALGMGVVYVTAAGALAGVGTQAAEESSGREIALTAAFLSVAAASEELVYRGYPLQMLMRAAGTAPAVLCISAVFGLGHHLNPSATWQGTLNTFLAGILLSLAYLRTRSLWLPYGIHVGWNLASGILLGLPVSGVGLASIGTTEVGGPRWLTGGSFGPEGGILFTVAIIAAAVFIGTTGRVEVSPTVRTALLPAARGRGRGSAG
jgi:hypothetical protein